VKRFGPKFTDKTDRYKLEINVSLRLL
jgi:hypothetical protein